MAGNTDPTPTHPGHQDPEALAAALAKLGPDEFKRITEEAAAAQSLNADVTDRELVAKWFPTRGMPQGVAQVNEHAQLMAFQILAHAQNRADAGQALHHLRACCFFACEAIRPGE